MPTIENLVSVPEAAKLTRLSTRMFWKLIHEARAPAVIRIGRAVRIRASDLDLWLRLGCPTRVQLEAAKAAGRGANP